MRERPRIVVMGGSMSASRTSTKCITSGSSVNRPQSEAVCCRRPAQKVAECGCGQTRRLRQSPPRSWPRRTNAPGRQCPALYVQPARYFLASPPLQPTSIALQDGWINSPQGRLFQMYVQDAPLSAAYLGNESCSFQVSKLRPGAPAGRHHFVEKAVLSKIMVSSTACDMIRPLGPDSYD